MPSDFLTQLHKRKSFSRCGNAQNRFVGLQVGFIVVESVLTPILIGGGGILRKGPGMQKRGWRGQTVLMLRCPAAKMPPPVFTTRSTCFQLHEKRRLVFSGTARNLWLTQYMQ